MYNIRKQLITMRDQKTRLLLLVFLYDRFLLLSILVLQKVRLLAM